MPLITNIDQAVQRFDAHIKNPGAHIKNETYTLLIKARDALKTLQSKIRWAPITLRKNLNNEAFSKARTALIQVLLDEQPTGFEGCTQNKPIGNFSWGSRYFTRGESAYETLMVLAKISPTNQECPISVESINPGDDFYNIHGQKFDIKMLARWIQQKEAFINPLDNLEFHMQDQWSILKLCIQKNLLFYYLDNNPQPNSLPINCDENYTRNQIITVNKAIENLRERKIMAAVIHLVVHTATLAQLEAIASGLNIEDIIEITEDSQIKAVISLRSHGLTSKAFADKPWFKFASHQYALRKLVCNSNPPKTLEEAFKILQDLTDIQAQGVYYGLSRKEVMELNESQIKAFSNFHEMGIKIEHVKNQAWCASKCHIEALEIFIGMKYNYSSIPEAPRTPLDIDTAVSLISIMNQDELIGVLQGNLDKEEVMGLNKSQINALIDLKAKGLHRDHLLGKNWFCSYWHTELLRVRCQNLPICEALHSMNGISASYAEGYCKGLSNEDMEGLLEPQIQLIIEFKDKGLKSTDLRNKKAFQNTNNLQLMRQFFNDHPVQEVIAILEEAYPAKVSAFQLSTLLKFRHIGLKHKDLSGKQWFYNVTHVSLLETLTEHYHPIQAALKAMDGISADQADNAKKKIEKLDKKARCIASVQAILETENIKTSSITRCTIQ